MTGNVHGDLARTLVTVTADDVDVTPAQTRRLTGYLIEAADVFPFDGVGRAVVS